MEETAAETFSPQVSFGDRKVSLSKGSPCIMWTGADGCNVLNQHDRAKGAVDAVQLV